MSAATPCATRWSFTTGVCPTAWLMLSSAPFIMSAPRRAELAHVSFAQNGLARGGASGQTTPMALAFDGIALIAHGARDARWMVPLHRLKSDLAQRLAPTPVSLAFLEFA